LAETTNYTVATDKSKVTILQASATAGTYTVEYKVASSTPSIEAYLYIDGKAFANGKLTNDKSSYSFNSIGTIKVGEKLPFEIKVVPTIDAAQEIYLNVVAEGTDSNGNETTTTQESTATLKVKGEATMDLTTSSSSDSVSDVTNNVTIYQGTLNVENGSTVLNDFEVTFAAPTNVTLSNAKLVIDGETVASLNTVASPLVFNSSIATAD
jgi:hypothetical protein